MTFTTMQQVYDALPGYQTRFLMTGISGSSSGTSGFRICPQRQYGASSPVIPSAQFGFSAVAPGSVCDRTKAGALALPNVLSGHMLRVARARTKLDGIANPFWWMLTDRLVECAFNPSLTTVQNLNTVALPARAPANGVGVQMSFEVLPNSGSPLGGSSVGTFQVTYTNDQGGTSVVTYTNHNAWSGLSGAVREPAIPLADGDQGVRSVQSVQITANPSTTTGNVYGVVLYVPIFLFNYAWHYEQSSPVGGEQQDWFDTALAPVDPDACLELTTGGSSTTGYSVELDLVVD